MTHQEKGQRLIIACAIIILLTTFFGYVLPGAILMWRAL